MAGFKMHVSTSSLLGCGYAAAGILHGFPPDSALVGGAMCGFAGMLPDLDSDYGTPLRETMCFVSATVPMLLLDRFATFRMSHDAIVLLAVIIYLFMRFGVTKMIRKYTVHRGMFHSIPALLTFAGVAFLISGNSDINIRYFKAGGVALGVMSHLVLDEIYAVEFAHGRWRLKKSFGTAIKFWGQDGWANFSCYVKLLIVAGMILGEPNVMQQIQARNPDLARRYQELQRDYSDIAADLPNVKLPNLPTTQSNSQPGGSWNPFARQSASPAPSTPITLPQSTSAPPNYQQQPNYPATTPINPYDMPPTQVPISDGYDTAQRPAWPNPQ
jgi:LexA-binding, inner membrane-associated putative hydrolase